MTSGFFGYEASSFHESNQLCSGLPQDRGLGSVVDDHVAILRTKAVDVESPLPVTSTLILQSARMVAVVASDQANTSTALSSMEGDWIEVSQSKDRKKGRGSRKC